MLKSIYHAIVIGKARSAANHVERNLSEKEYNDIGYIISTFKSKSVEAIIKDLNEAD